MHKQTSIASVDDDPLAVATDPANMLPTQIARWAAADPERLFLVEVGGRSVTYGEFQAEVLRYCGWLRALGLQPGDRIAACLPASIDAYVLWIAAASIGLLEVPINRELRGEFLIHVLRDAAIRHCFVRPEDIELLRSVDIELTIHTIARDKSPVSDIPPATTLHSPLPADVATVIYTSGTTGPAKGVVVTWGQVATMLGRLPRDWLSADDTVYAPWPIFHVTGRSPMVSMADVGGRVVLREKFSLSEFWSDVRTYRCTVMTVSAIMQLLLGVPPSSDDCEHTLRIGLAGLPGAFNLEFQRRFNVRLVYFYGSTEIGFPIANRDVNPATADTSGWPRRGYSVRVVNEQGAECGPGEVGELWVRPPARELMMQGYLGRDELTAKAVVDGWYHTGDAFVRSADGSFRFIDRMRDTIRRFGENISSVALETEISKDEAVLECAVVGVPSSISGKEILLAVTSKPGAALAPESLYERLVATLPKYMLPSFIAVHVELPKTPSGKIRKSELADMDGVQWWVSPAADSDRTKQKQTQQALQ